jgi:hypothetical protein
MPPSSSVVKKLESMVVGQFPFPQETAMLKRVADEGATATRSKESKIYDDLCCGLGSEVESHSLCS